MNNPTVNSEPTVKLEVGDIIQITNNDHHWFGCLIVVSEPKSFGCQGYISIPHDNAGNVGDAYIRLNHSDFERVGHAVLVRGSAAEREQSNEQHS